MNDSLSPGAYREAGKALLRCSDPELRSEGIKNILYAYSKNDVEAIYLVGELLLCGFIKPIEGDPEEQAMKVLCRAARCGSLQARSLLNAYSNARYTANLDKHVSAQVRQGPLVDFDGTPVSISRKGLFTPVDAVLSYENGVNCLTLNVNVVFMYGDKSVFSDIGKFENAVLSGMKEWEGEYRVFNNQEIKVAVNVTTENRLFDNVYILPLYDDMKDLMGKIVNAVGTKEAKKRINPMIFDSRSFAAIGRKWSVHSRKFIFIKSDSSTFDDYEELKDVAKHEFGHALGLGDLYEDASDQLKGVEKGTYYELDGYYLSDKFYNLVMCDHHGPVSNNDIEMVLLAFRENKMQKYQPDKFKGSISSALGRGN